jgi:energy-coupling factor transporter ATP-binding protein EcfA2
MPESVDFLTPSETEHLLKNCDDARTTALIVLCLNAGLYVNELTRLKLDSVDWQQRTLKVPGKRAREIKLDPQTYDALAAWSHERPTVKSDALFICLRGDYGGLEKTSIGQALRTHGRRCGLNRELNPKLLRDTFAIRLVSQKKNSLAETVALLALTNGRSLDRYIRAAKVTVPSVPEELDQRSRLRRALSRYFPAKPKIKRRPIERPPLPAGETLFGRAGVIAEIKSDISRHNSVLLTGPLGIGKTELLSHLAKLYPGALKIEAPLPVRAVLKQVLDRIDPGSKLPVSKLTPNGELLARIEAAGNHNVLLLIDNLERLKAPEADHFLRLVDKFTVVGASSATPERLQALWYKFREIRLANLRPETVRQMVRHLTADLPIDDREMLETRISTLSNGLPLAIVGMVRQVNHEPVIDKEAIRGVYHEAGVKYRDWTPFLIILWGVVLAARFVALGTHSYENYILAGVSAAVLMTTIRFLRMIR